MSWPRTNANVRVLRTVFSSPLEGPPHDSFDIDLEREVLMSLLVMREERL